MHKVEPKTLYFNFVWLLQIRFLRFLSKSLSVSRAVSQVIIRVHKPTVAYKLVQPCSKNPKEAPWLIYYKNNKNIK